MQKLSSVTVSVREFLVVACSECGVLIVVSSYRYFQAVSTGAACCEVAFGNGVLSTPGSQSDATDRVAKGR